MSKKIIECDVAIIGGGVAGALIAHHLTTHKRNVVVLEAGTRVDREKAVAAWAASSTKSLTSPYLDSTFPKFAEFPDGSGNYNQVNKDSFKSTYVKREGGTTWHWQGHTPRLLPGDFRLKTLYDKAVDWPIGYDELEKWYTAAEKELGVSGNHEQWDGALGANRSKPFPMPSIWPSYADQKFRERLGNLFIGGVPVILREMPQARNSQPYQDRPVCAGNSTCIPLCPIGAKYDASVHLRLAEATGYLQIETSAIATRIRPLYGSDQIEAVEYVSWADKELEYGEVRARRYVLAAHAIESVRLLLRLDDERPHLKSVVGHFLMDHPTGQMVGLSNEPWFTFRGPPVTTGIDEWRDGKFRYDRAAWKSSLGNDGQGRLRGPEKIVGELLNEGLFGRDLRQQFEQKLPCLYRMSFATEQLPDFNNVVLPDGKDQFGVPTIKLKYKVDDYTLRTFRWAGGILEEIFKKVGIIQIVRGDDPSKYGGSGHIMGTTRMGDKAEESVADRDCRRHKVDNLFVVGSGLFPTVGTANPTLTIAALALRAAAKIDSEL